MCYSYGSIDQAANPCPMCKVFPSARCNHLHDVCRNRALHPRMDVLFLKNAEVQCFNGCGFCKWANQDPKAAGYNNPGWPGCCRPPSISEHSLIQIADWRAVSIVHQVAIPPQIKAILDNLSMKLPPIVTAPQAARTPSKSSIISPSRKNSSATTPSKPLKVASNTPPATLRGRSPQTGTPPSANISRSSSSTHITSSPISLSPREHSQTRRKPSISDKRVEGSNSSNSSPTRKSIDVENPVTPRRVSNARRPTVTPATTSVSISKVVAADSRQSNQSPPSVKRRPSVSGSTPPPPATPSRPQPRNTGFTAGRSRPEVDDCGASTGSGGSDSLGSLSDSTITSEGFTDYLSDESEAELQRQAEAKAAVLAQMQAEELEFKAARQQLAHVDLRPPKTWNPNNQAERNYHNGGGATFRNSSRNANVPQSFAAAATAMVQSAQARG